MPIKSNELMSIEELIVYLRKDLVWLEGFSEAVDSAALKNKVHTMRSNINKFEKCQDPAMYPLEINKESFLKS